jgi:ABC-2 type transport system permease protein
MGSHAQFLPTYHFAQLAYRGVMPSDEAAAFSGGSSSPVSFHLGVIVVSAVLFATVAGLPARREAVTWRA